MLEENLELCTIISMLKDSCFVCFKNDHRSEDCRKEIKLVYTLWKQ